MLERGNCQGLTTKGTKDTKKYYPCPLRTSSNKVNEIIKKDLNTTQWFKINKVRWS